MATTTNYGWTTPDDTALVKDGASAIRTLGTSVDTTTKNLNPSTTLGDIEYRSSTANTNTRLGIGSTGNVLTVAGGVPTWAVPPGTANYTLLNSGSTSLSGSSTKTISGISGINQLMIVVRGASTGTDNSAMYIRFNSDSGSNYRNISSYIELTGTYDTNYWNISSGSDTTLIYLGQMDNSASSAMYGQIKIDGCNASGVKPYQFNGGGSIQSITSASGPVWYWGGGVYTGSSTISSVSLISGDTFDAGDIYVYGA